MGDFDHGGMDPNWTPPSQEAALREVLKEVMDWIDNWDPNFLDDEEWSATREKVDALL
jgi:hypothetical protein